MIVIMDTTIYYIVIVHGGKTYCTSGHGTSDMAVIDQSSFGLMVRFIQEMWVLAGVGTRRQQKPRGT